MARKITRAQRILSIDVGGSSLKAAIIDAKGRFLTPRRRVKTPQPCPPKAFFVALDDLIVGLSGFDCVSVGFPGYVRDGVVHSGPNLAPKEWSKKIPLAALLSKKLGVPVRLANDADMQGLAAIKGRGLEFVVTLGTGFGTSWFRDGELMPHMEIGLSPSPNGKIYDAYLGDAAYRKIGSRKWNARLKGALSALHTMLNYDHIYLGGGNTRHIRFKLPPSVSIVSNNAGIKGGAGLWHRPGAKKQART